MASGDQVVMQPAARRPPLRVALVGGLHVGIETAFRNVVSAAELDPGVDALVMGIDSYEADRIERWLPFLPASTRAHLRYIAGTRSLFTMSRPDAVWAHLDISLLPWMLTRNVRGAVPLVYATDSTPRQVRAFGHYGRWGGRSDRKFRLRDSLYGLFVRRAAALQVWTNWARRSLRDDYGVPAERIHVLPPGLDTSFWTPAELEAPRPVPRTLFVGGDFQRKGGDLLLDVYRQRFRGRIELHLVTRRGIIAQEPGVEVHRGLRPNDGSLRRLYRRSDVLVIPTRADCFSMAGLEAMACGLPVITCPVGGVAELLTDGREGFFVPTDDERALGDALEALVSDPARRRRMGAAARKLAIERYDGTTNTRRLLALIAVVARG